MIEDDGEHNDADEDKYGDVLSLRHIDHRGLRKFDEHEEFKNMVMRKISSAQALGQTKRAKVTNVSASGGVHKRCV